MKSKYLVLGLVFLLIFPMVNAALVSDLLAYYKLDNTAGTVIDELGNFPGTNNGATRNIAGQINKSFDFEAGDTDDNVSIGQLDLVNNYSINIWVKKEGTGTNRHMLGAALGIEMRIDTTEKIKVGKQGVGQVSSTQTVGTDWIMITYVSNGTDALIYLNGTLDSAQAFTSDLNTGVDYFIGHGGPGEEMDGLIDELGIWNRTLTAAEVTELWNSTDGTTYPFGEAEVVVDLLTPVNDSNEIAEVINFTAEITPSSVNITNATFFLYNSDGSLNTTIFNVTNNGLNAFNYSWTANDFEIGSSYLWNVQACSNSTVTSCYFAGTNFTFSSSSFTESSITFNSSVLETSRQRYELEIGAISDVNSVSALMHYNGTSYTSLVIDNSGNNYTLINAFDVPLANTTGDKNFFWEITFTLNDGTTSSENSILRTQEVNRTFLSICNGTYTEAFINITTYNAENPFPILNASFKSAWSWFVNGGGGTVFRTYAYEDITEGNNTFNFCMSDPSATYLTSSTFEIDGTGYAKNFHFLTNATFTNSSQTLPLYLLNDSLATATVLFVRDGQQAPIENVFIQIQFYDVGTDTFYTVGMAQTSSEGEDLVYLNWFDSLYKFIFIKDGEVIKTTTPYKITETPQIFDVITDVTFEFAKFDDFLYSLFFNDTTNNFVLTFIKPSGEIDAGCLRVIKRNQTNDYLICETCEVSSSATLYCNIADWGNGTFIATFYATGSLKIIDTIDTIIGIASKVYLELGNADGTILAIIFSGVIMTFFLISPVLGVVGLLIGVLGSYALGFQPIDYGVFIGLLIVGGSVIWFLKR